MSLRHPLLRTLALLMLVELCQQEAELVFAQSKTPETWDVTKARGTTREIEFDTSEGTWMSLSLSPDGKWIVFDLLAHIYRIPASGGKAECLTQNSGVALNYHPRYSPDGKSIAFISDRGGQDNLWLMDADGGHPRAVFDDKDIRVRQPAWTPDGQYILVRRDSVASGLEPPPPSGIWMYNREGGKGIEIIGKDEKGADWPSSSGDGKYVYYYYVAGDPSSYAGHADSTQGYYQIKRLELRTSEIQEVTGGTAEQQYRSSNGGAVAPEISPDGRWLTFSRRIPNGTISYKGHMFGPRSALWLRDMNTGAERIVMDPIEVEMAEQFGTPRILPGYSWASDSKSIVITQGGKIHRLWIDSGKVENIPFEAHVHRTISEMAKAERRIDDGPFTAQFARWHTASPDEKTLAFQALGRIWLMDLPGGTPRRLTSATFAPMEYAPAWSKDGKWLAFTTWDEKYGGQLFKVAKDGKAPQQLTTMAGEYINPVWSPDGQTIVVARGSGESLRGRSWGANPWYDLVRVPTEGGDTKQIARVPRPQGGDRMERRQIVAPSFGPDGRVYYPELFLSKGDAAGRERVMTNFVSVNEDGTDRRVHMIFPYADEATPSPDGKWIAFQEGDNVYVVAFPLAGTGGKPPVLDRKGPVFPVKTVTTKGGNFPRWRDAQTLEYGSAMTYGTYNVESAKSETTQIHLIATRKIPKGSIALVGARIITEDTQKVIEKGSIVIKGSRILCVGECSTSGVDHVVDAGGKTIIPGLIDMHSHHYADYSGITPPHNYENAIYLAYGVTSNLDPAAWSDNVFPAAELIDASEMIGPRTYSTGDPFYRGDGVRNNDLTSLQVTEDNVDRLKSYGVITLKQYLQARRDQRQWVSEIGRKKGMNVTAEGVGLEYDLSMAMDGQTGVEHPLAYLPLYGDATRFFGMAHFFYSPTAIVAGAGPWNEEYFYQSKDWFKDEKLLRWTPWREIVPHARTRMLRPDTSYSFPFIAQALADVMANGGHGALGGHGQQNGIGTQWELWMYADVMGAQGALELGTMEGARYLGMDKDLGSITAGKLADLVILNKNPLEDIHNSSEIHAVMKGGILYDGETLDELWPEKKPFGEYYWAFPAAVQNDDRPANYWEHE